MRLCALGVHTDVGPRAGSSSPFTGAATAAHTERGATFESMAESLRGGLSLCTSGFGFWSHDIGGFEQTPVHTMCGHADVYKRWCAFGLLSSHSRLHGSSSYRVPWLFDEEGESGPTASDVLRFFTKLKCRLMPYLYAAAVDAHETGVPVMRAMPLEFPDDPACDTLDRQYMLGERLLVAPVFTPDGMVDYYLPTGRWTNFLSGETVEGGRWLREQHGYLSLPLMVRPSTVLPVGANEDRPEYDYAEAITYHVFALDEGSAATAQVPALDGCVETTVVARCRGAQIEVAVQGTTKPWSVLLRGIEDVASVTGGTAQQDALGAHVKPDAGVQAVIVHL